MELNFLTFNEKKTEIIVFGKSELLDGINSVLGPLASYCHLSAKNLIIFDSCFKFEQQINSVVKTSLFQLQLLGKVKAHLPLIEYERFLHMFITSCLDYCNSLYFGVDWSLLCRVQLVQNAVARLLTGKRQRDHITPVLASPHWLPISFRIQFKILLLVFKTLHGLVPPYLCELLHLHAPVRVLWSIHQMLLDVPRCRLVTGGDRAFAVAGPNLWNSLPVNIRTAHFIQVFKTLLKTHLCALAFNTCWLWLLSFMLLFIIFFYLLFFIVLLFDSYFYIVLLLCFKLVQHFGQLTLFLKVLYI